MIDREHPGWAASRINFNMRCFEITGRTQKFGRIAMINFNMRCFEINFPERLPPAHREINFNMRCFEIAYRQMTSVPGLR